MEWDTTLCRLWSHRADPALMEPIASHFRSYTTCSVYFPWILLMKKMQPGVCKGSEEVLHSTEKSLALRLSQHTKTPRRCSQARDTGLPTMLAAHPATFHSPGAPVTQRDHQGLFSCFPEWKHHLNRVLGTCRSCQAERRTRTKERRRDSTVHPGKRWHVQRACGRDGGEGQEDKKAGTGRHAKRRLEPR